MPETRVDVIAGLGGVLRPEALTAEDHAAVDTRPARSPQPGVARHVPQRLMMRAASSLRPVVKRSAA